MLINKHDSQLGIAEGALAVINIIPGLNIEIYNVFREINDDYVIWKYSDETQYLRRSKLRSNKFRVGRQWYSLNDALRYNFF